MAVLARGLQLSLGLLLSLAIGLGGFAFVAIGAAVAAPVQPDLVELRVHLGNTANELKFTPNQIEFEGGKRYKLILDNPSSQKHYFTAKDFAGVIWTQKVDAGNVEIKGAISELELRPGSHAEWVFVPLKSGTYELRCSIPGHTEAGMKGMLAIT
jgi:uncharacterized cupredoxin-like copper-binding protein